MKGWINMIYVFEGGSIVYDGSTLNEEQKARAVAVEKLPEPKVIEGKVAILKVNKEEGVYYEYINKPNDPLENEIEELKQVVADLTELVLLGGV